MVTEKMPFAQKLLLLKMEYIEKLPGKLEEILNDWNSLKVRHSIETITLLHRNVHNLIGTSGTFGFTELSKSARNLETILKPLVEHDTQNFSFNTELAQTIHANIDKLFLLLEAIQADIKNMQ